MVGNIELLGLLVSTILGSLIQSILGWKDSNPNAPFDWNKYWPSIVRAIIAAILVFVGSYSGFVGEVNLFTYLVAFLAGMGIDAVGNRLSGILQNSSSNSTSTPPVTPKTTAITKLPTKVMSLRARLMFLLLRK